MDLENILSLVTNNPNELRARAKSLRKQLYGTTVTYSRNFFIPVTKQCRNNCGYCSFSSKSSESWIKPENYKEMLQKAKQANCSEILLTLGEKPEDRYESARNFLFSEGFTSTVEYVKYFCELALQLNLLPHSNLGVLGYKELRTLKDVNASMGLMLESSSLRLLNEGKAHFASKGKNPELRLKTIENAGKLRIPFTTGILIGIGETWVERIQSLLDLSSLSKKYNHIQEVIIQNFIPHPQTRMYNVSPPSSEEFILSVSLARIIMPSNVSIQIPPNLNRYRIIESLNFGANDIGGISPLTVDYINPNEPWPRENEIKIFLESKDFELKQRLPVYSQYEKYLNKRIRTIINDFYSFN